MIKYNFTFKLWIDNWDVLSVYKIILQLLSLIIEIGINCCVFVLGFNNFKIKIWLEFTINVGIPVITKSDEKHVTPLLID